MPAPLRLFVDASWRGAFVQLLCFAALFATYDLKILSRQRRAPHGVSLVNYIVRDDRTDESAMYMSAVRELVDGDFSSTDPYLKPYRDLPDIRPRLPAWIGLVCYRLAGSTNGAVILMHALPPAIAAVLLVRLFALLVGPSWGLALAVLSVGGICYEFNAYVNWLRITELSGPASCNPEFHLFRPYSLHLSISRYFSPGLTLGFFLLGLLPAARDPDFERHGTAALVGAAIGLQMEVYPHAALVLGTLAAVLLWIGYRRRRADRSHREALSFVSRNAAMMAVAAAIVAAPWIARWAHFRQIDQAADIVARVGFHDDRVDVQRTPILAWLVIAVLVRRAANRAAGRRPGDFTATPRDRFWTAAMIASAITAWLPGILGDHGLFPQPWLISLRCLCFIVPGLVGYSAIEWLRAARPQWTVNRLARSLAAAALLGYVAILFYGEFAAGRNNAHLYAITPEMAHCRDSILANTPPQATILTDDLRLVSYLVCETDRDSYIGYGASSNASTDELVERVMIPCVLQGIAFEQFHADYYQRGRGLPDGPTGAHWALHHGGDFQPIAAEHLQIMYERLQKLSPRKLVDRYPFDFCYLPSGRLDDRYQPWFNATADPMLFSRRNGAEDVKSPEIMKSTKH